MLYCSNPNCADPFNSKDVQACTSCGSSQLLSLVRDRYQIINPLGKGGFGRTYIARDRDCLNRTCVIKQFYPSSQNPNSLEKAKELFAQEAKQLYELGKHEQIPELYAFFEENRCLYLVQQFIEGQNLLTELIQQGNFTEEKIRHLLNNLLPVLKFIHDRQIIHRDIKPENIMRRSPLPGEKFGSLVLIDFGISKQIITPGSIGTVIGTPGYASVEQLGGQVYPASDLYSLGITCIQLLTGYFPQLDGGKSYWRENPGITISEQLTKVLDKLIQINLSDRYQTVDELLADLNHKKTNTRQIIQKNRVRYVGGVVLKSPDVQELVRIAKLSVPLLELRCHENRVSSGSSFMYKQAIFDYQGRSRCYFMTNLHFITSIYKPTSELLTQLATSGVNINSLKLDFVATWNQQEYRVDKFLIPKQAFFEIETNPNIRHLDFALFYIDIPSVDILDFFGIATRSNLDIGEKIYAFGHPQGMNLSLTDGIVSHIYKQYLEGKDNPITKGAIGHNILINPENSGGPTVNGLGEIVGISSRGIEFSLSLKIILEMLQKNSSLELLDINIFSNKLKRNIYV